MAAFDRKLAFHNSVPDRVLDAASDPLADCPGDVIIGRADDPATMGVGGVFVWGH